MARIKSLPIELQKVAETELGEVPSRIPDDLLALRTWIEQAPHLNACLDEQLLIQFLRGCKYSLEKAKSKIDLFYTLKSKFPEMFNVTDVLDPKFKNIYKYGFALPLPRPLNDNGPRIVYFKFEGDIGKGLIDIEDLYRVANSLHEIILLDDPYTCINGIIFIIDLKNLSLNMASQATPSFTRKIVQYYYVSLPLRIKGVYILNTPGYFQGIMNLFISLVSEKLKHRIHFYGSNYHDDLRKIIPNKYLPVELGGENGSTDEIVKDFDKKWSEYESYFKRNSNYGTNELLRPGKPIDFDSIYGLGGSFRKLDVD